MFAIGSSAVVHRPGHRMPGDERRRHSGLQHRVTQFSLKLPSRRGRQLRSGCRHRRPATEFTLSDMKQTPAHLAG